MLNAIRLSMKMNTSSLVAAKYKANGKKKKKKKEEQTHNSVNIKSKLNDGVIVVVCVLFLLV